MKYRYKILAKYPNSEKDTSWGEWQVGTFYCLKDAKEYMGRTTERYAKFEPKYLLEMRAEKITEKAAEEWGTLLNNMID